jgi:hypothetical protein
MGRSDIAAKTGRLAALAGESRQLSATVGGSVLDMFGWKNSRGLVQGKVPTWADFCSTLNQAIMLGCDARKCEKVGSSEKTREEGSMLILNVFDIFQRVLSK